MSTKHSYPEVNSGEDEEGLLEQVSGIIFTTHVPRTILWFLPNSILLFLIPLSPNTTLKLVNGRRAEEEALQFRFTVQLKTKETRTRKLYGGKKKWRRDDWRWTRYVSQWATSLLLSGIRRLPSGNYYQPPTTQENCGQREGEWRM